MRIKKLIVKKTVPSEEVIREVIFNLNGLSLIVDITSNTVTESGNNVGKTTVIRIIDLCLGARNVKDLYHDADTGSENDDVKELLTKHKVQAELILIGPHEEEIRIRRDLFSKGKKYIGDTIYPQDEFGAELKKILFDSPDENPTLRQLIPKFVRVSNTSAEGMLKFLPSMTHNNVYDGVYSFLFRAFSVDLVSLKQDLSAQLSECRKNITLLEKNQHIDSLSNLQQKRDFIDNELLRYSEKRRALSYLDTYKEEIEKRRALTSRINVLSSKLELINFEKDTIVDSLRALESEKAGVDVSLLAAIYKEAQMYIPKLQKNYEELVSFHNEVIQNRMNFIQKQLEIKEAQRRDYLDQFNGLVEEKAKVAIDVLDEGLLAEFNTINIRIEKLSEQKGEVAQSIKMLESLKEQERGLQDEIEKIDETVDGKLINEKIIVFNEFFTGYCEKLFGEKYFLTYNADWKKDKDSDFPVKINSLDGNLGTGMKKAIIAAFDLAYLKYAEAMNIPSPQFVIHDKLENTHINQLKSVFEICEELDGQYIIPILRERINAIDHQYIEKAKVLELSQEDKFFRI